MEAQSGTLLGTTGALLNFDPAGGLGVPPARARNKGARAGVRGGQYSWTRDKAEEGFPRKV